MSRLRFVLPAVAALALTMFTPQVFALAQTQETARAGASSTRIYTITQKQVNLSPIVIYGKHLPLPLALQLYKTALTRAWSGNPADRNKLVCWWEATVGTHLQTLHCMTNGQHQRLASQTQLGWGKYGPDGIYDALINGQIPMVLAGYTTRQPIRRGPAAALLKRLPSANASYTMRVTDHGQPVLAYVIKNGELVHIYHYVYKKGQKHAKY
ncbi:MAG: hypothetical protein ACRES9_06505 [Gammaproteobacteria bacterium]